MIYIDKAGKRVNIHAPYGGFSRLDSPELRAEAGVSEVAAPQPPNDYSPERYIVQEVDEAPYVLYVPRDPAVVARALQAKANAAALQTLAETDWYAIRYAETGVPIPEDVLALRAEARASIVKLEEP